MNVAHEMAAWGRFVLVLHKYICVVSILQVEVMTPWMTGRERWRKLFESMVTDLEKRDNVRCMNKPKTWPLKGRHQLKIGMWNWK